MYHTNRHRNCKVFFWGRETHMRQGADAIGLADLAVLSYPPFQPSALLSREPD